jgi:hypothetical protein
MMNNLLFDRVEVIGHSGIKNRCDRLQRGFIITAVGYSSDLEYPL